MGRVLLEGLEFFGRHGVMAQEAELGARFVIDLELVWDFAGIPDDITAAANYAEVYETVRQEVTGQRYGLIEVLADRLARRVLASQPLLTQVMVRVHKPHAPLPGVFRDVVAELSLKRAELSAALETPPSPAP